MKHFSHNLAEKIDPQGEYFEQWWQYRGGKQGPQGGEEMVATKHSNQLSKKISTLVSAHNFCSFMYIIMITYVQVSVYVTTRGEVLVNRTKDATEALNSVNKLSKWAQGKWLL